MAAIERNVDNNWKMVSICIEHGNVRIDDHPLADFFFFILKWDLFFAFIQNYVKMDAAIINVIMSSSTGEATTNIVV